MKFNKPSGCLNTKDPLPSRTIVMAHSHTHDMTASYICGGELSEFCSLTRRVMKPKKGVGKSGAVKRSIPDGEWQTSLLCLVCCVTHILSFTHFHQYTLRHAQHSTSIKQSKVPWNQQLLAATCELNLLVPTLKDQYSLKSLADPSLDLSGRRPAETCSPIVIMVMNEDQVAVLPGSPVATMNHETTQQCDGDSWLGDLDHRFDPTLCRSLTDQDLCQCNSRVVILTEQMEHGLHCGTMEYYLLDNLKHC